MSKRMGAAVVLLLLSLSATAEEKGIRYATAFELGFKKLDFEVNQANGINPTYSPNLTTLGIAMTATYNNVYGSLGVERTIERGEVSSIVNGVYQNSRFDRDESIATIGYQLGSHYTVFLGFLDTHVNRHSDLSYGGYGSNGPFVGVSYAQPIGSNGRLITSVAYAEMNGNFTRISSTKEKSDADAAGASYTLSWVARLNESLSYRIGFKANRYLYDTVVGGVPRTAGQDYNALVIGLMHYF